MQSRKILSSHVIIAFIADFAYPSWFSWRGCPLGPSTRSVYRQLPFHVFSSMPRGRSNRLPCYPFHQHTLNRQLAKPTTPSMFVHTPRFSPFDLVYSSRRRKRHVLKTLSPPASELARRVEALAVTSENEV
jgi:hypothetical protein